MDKLFYNQASQEKLGWEPEINVDELARMMYTNDLREQERNLISDKGRIAKVS